MLWLRLLSLLLLFLVVMPVTAAEARADQILSSLVDPVKIDQLEGKRAANSRLRKIVYWVEMARRDGEDPAVVLENAQRLAGYFGTVRADADRESILRNRLIIEKLGCFDEAGLLALRKGNAPTITRGPYAGDIASVDHIIPRSIVEELDEKLYNLEFMPSRLNGKKSNSIGVRQRQLAVKWAALGLLSQEGLRLVVQRGS